MTLSQFEFENEGPLEKVECEDVPDLMVIAGPNGVGKTTLLNNIASKFQNRFSVVPSGSVDRLIQETEMMLRRNKTSSTKPGRYLNTPSRVNSYSNTNSDQTNVAFVGPHRGMSNNLEIRESHLIGMPTYSSKFLYSLSKANQNTLNQWLNKGEGNIRSGPYRDRQKGFSDQLPYYEVRRRLSQIEYKVGEYKKENYGQQKEAEDDPVLGWLSPMQDAISEVLPGIELEEVQKENHRYVLNFRNRDGSIVNFEGLSSGEKDTIALLFLLIEDEIEEQFSDIDIVETSRNDLVVLYDSPEVYLHPQLQLRFINYIKDLLQTRTEEERNLQIIICSHSKMVIDNVPDESLYYLFFPDQVDENQLQPASDVPDELRALISEEIGLTALSSGEDILLVEGEDDREVFQRVGQDLYNDLSIIQMNGKEQIVELDSAFNKLVPKLKQNGVNLYAIVDRDRDLDLEEYVSDYLHFLPATSIENIVLNPEAIFQTVRQVHGIDLGDLGYKDADDVESLLANIVTDEDFIEEEAEMRWNEQFNPFNLSYGSYRSAEEFADINSFAENEIQNRLNHIKNFDEIREEVERLAKNGNRDDLHGKKILKKVSEEFEIKSDRLLRICASHLKFQDLPEETREFLMRIDQESSS